MALDFTYQVYVKDGTQYADIKFSNGSTVTISRAQYDHLKNLRLDEAFGMSTDNVRLLVHAARAKLGTGDPLP